MPGLMGTIQVNSENSDQALGADMEAGVVRTSDGGRTWESLGNGFRATSVAQNPRIPAELVAIGASEAAVSRDGGSTWEPLDVPEGTAAATYDSVGELVVAALVRDEAVTYRLRAGKWYPA